MPRQNVYDNASDQPNDDNVDDFEDIDAEEIDNLCNDEEQLENEANNEENIEQAGVPENNDDQNIEQPWYRTT